MKMMPCIYKILQPFFKENGYTKQRNYFYKVENEIAFCVLFERPSDWVYVTCYIMPMYIPTEWRYLNYGNRLTNMRHVSLPQLTGKSTEQELSDWCRLVRRILETDIFPFYEKISTPMRLLNFLDKYECDRFGFFHRGDDDTIRLRIYTELYLHKYDGFEKNVMQFIDAVQSNPYIPSIKEKFANEMVELREYLEHGEAFMDEYFLKVCSHTREVCF